MLCGAKSCVDLADFAEIKEDELKEFLEMRGGPPWTYPAKVESILILYVYTEGAMRTSLICLIFSLFFMISSANAACVYASYQENDGSLSEITFPVREDTADRLTALGYKEVTCKKDYSAQKINQKCAKMNAWPDKMKSTFSARFKITAAKMCQYSLEYVNSQN